MKLTSKIELADKQDLISNYLNDKSQKNFEALVLAYTPFAKQLAKKYKGYPVPLEDLQQEAILGLMAAIINYNPERKVQFSTYAYSNVKWSLHHYITTSGMFVSVITTKDAKKLFYNLKEAKKSLNILHNNNLTPQEVLLISKKLDVSEKNVILMDRFLHSSIITKTKEGEPIVDLLASFSKGIEEKVTHKEIMKKYKEYLGALNDRERYILEMHYLKEKTLTLQEIGKILGLTKERTRQIENGAIQKLAQKIAEITF